MYKHGNLSKNDIKLFPFLLYRILEKKSELSAEDDDLLGQGSEQSVDNWLKRKCLLGSPAPSCDSSKQFFFY